jgi:hypothetical protein
MHIWDVAAPTGQTPDWDPAVVALALAATQRSRPRWRPPPSAAG